MNRKSILIWAMAIGTLSSCMSDGDVYDPEKIEAMKVAKYEAAFVKKYGKVDPKQDWGFGEAEAATKAVTRVPDMDGNNWYTKVEEIPEVVSAEEIEMVKEAFSQREESTPNVEMRWSDFFIQQVYYPKDRQYKTKSGRMEKLYVTNLRYGLNKDCQNFGNNGEIQENTINSAQNTFLRRERMVFLHDEPLNGKFWCQVTLGTDSDFDDHYLIKKVGDSYYVGYDLESRGGTADQEVERDYVFDDAILKIVPARRKDIRRIMAEDLATDEGGDFDFNDVVFDAKVRTEWENGVRRDYADITLLAAGGTLPLYIGQKRPEYEVHKLFGVEQTTMVNTQEGKETEINPVKFTVELVDLPREAWGGISNGHPTLDDIPIYVGDSDIPLKGTTGEVPSKLCCPTNYIWSNERESIEDAFPNFVDAVAKGTEWYEGGNPGWQ